MPVNRAEARLFMRILGALSATRPILWLLCLPVGLVLASNLLAANWLLKLDDVWYVPGATNLGGTSTDGFIYLDGQPVAANDTFHGMSLILKNYAYKPQDCHLHGAEAALSMHGNDHQINFVGLNGGGCVSRYSANAASDWVKVHLYPKVGADVIVIPESTQPFLSITQVWSVSPDIYDANSRTLMGGGFLDGEIGTEVGLSDAVYATPFLISNVYEPCVDLTWDFAVSPGDAVLWATVIIHTAKCY